MTSKRWSLGKRWGVAIALCAWGLPGHGYAAVSEAEFQLRNTADFVDLCNATGADPLGVAAVNLCQGFAMGVYRVLQEEEAARTSGHLFCPPNPAPTRNQELTAFTQWARASPDRLAQSPQDGIAAYLAQQHPCPGQ
jgi:hypothetical protein